MTSLFRIDRCRNCPNSLIDLDHTEEILREVFEETDFNQRQSARMQTRKPKHHQIFRAAIAGCPNSCSQPQIKDYGIQGQMAPLPGSGCSLCGVCAGICPEGSITISEIENAPVIDRDKCLNCGMCIKHCPVKAMQPSRQGYKVLVGGKLGRHPRLATVHLALADEGQLRTSLKHNIELLLQHGLPGERLGQLLARMEK